MKIITKKLTVCGTVQMVGYRWFAKERANQLKIKGYVRNTGRGEVEIVAQGYNEDIQVFIDHLKQGPSRARIEKVIQESLNDEKVFQQFSIRM
ncbi:MAG: acylphosphatase [Candidatus Marinimicrobia bacterium]|nr:acylphosphatase [Candidatus Neomarinimicrobiota bacterium]